MKKILIVEDDDTLGSGLCLALEKEEIKVCVCGNLSTARENLRDGCDLILLDVNLPDGSGLDLLRELRQRGDATPIIMLTAKDTEMDIVSGFELGADDYIAKPFSLAVLCARVGAQLKRDKGRDKTDVYKRGSFTFDFDRLVFTKNGEKLELSKTEQKLLTFLVKNSGSTLSRGRLVDLVWTDGAEYVDENALSVAVKRLRDKLEDSPSEPKHIKTVYGIGYAWND